METKKTAGVATVIAIMLISLYSIHVTTALVTSYSIPPVIFNLGETINNIQYCNSQSLDLYVPNSTSRSLPVVIYLHGGGLMTGRYSGINTVFLNALASAGYAVASVNYRLAPQYKFPDQIEDAECSVRYLRANAATYGLNASEIGAFGDSSGGQLVSLLGLSSSASRFDIGPYPSVSSRIQAVVDMFGPTNLTEITSPSDPSVEEVYGNQSNLALASPSSYVSGGSAPFLIVQGVNDTNVPESQSIQFYNQLKAQGAQAGIILVDNSEHEFSQVGPNPINPSIGQVAQDMVTFFNQYLRIGGSN